MATALFTPILNDKTRAPNFFNGRLLSGEAMTDEQRAQKVAHSLLAESIGDGVVYGLTVELKSGTDITSPVVTVKSGVAINRCGEILLLANDTDVQLVPPAHVATPPATIFGLCKPPIADTSCSSDFQTLQPPQSGTYVADDGVYLLTICSIGAGNGLATVSGLGDAPKGCNIKYVVDAVEFRLLELPVDPSVRADTAHLRNWVAYHCFGVDDMLDYATDPFGVNADTEPHTLLDDIRGTQLTDCDVPLAALYWTATGGVQFVDLWSVRRRVAHTRAASAFPLDDVRLATAEAMRDQFKEHLRAVLDVASTPANVQASDSFRYLPPAGLVPLASAANPRAFVVTSFFQGKTWNSHANWPQPVYMEGGMLEALLRDSAKYPPVDLQDPEMIWLYSVRQNIVALNTSGSIQPYVVFANAGMPFFGEPRFDRSHFNYANFV